MRIQFVLFLLATILSLSNANRAWLITASSKLEAYYATQVGIGEINDTNYYKGLFDDFVSYYKKTYKKKSDKNNAFKIFQDNMKKVQMINRDLSITWWASGSIFSDIDRDTLKSQYLPFVNQIYSQYHVQQKPLKVPNVNVNVSSARIQNWMFYDKITAVKDQGSCGSCWAVSATSVIESALLISKGINYTSTDNFCLSHQQLVDCATSNYGSGGCSGGASDGAINYNHDNGQVIVNKYEQESNNNCGDFKNPSNEIAQLSDNAQHLFGELESTIMNRIDIQPIVAYFSVGDDFWLYRGGVYFPTDKNCAGYLNHAMMIYGYFYDGTSENSYWNLQNSWGANWGEQGRLRVRFTGDNVGACMMYNFMTYPTLNFNKIPDSIHFNPSSPSSPSDVPLSPYAPDIPSSPSDVPLSPYAPDIPSSSPDVPPMSPDVPSPRQPRSPPSTLKIKWSCKDCYKQKHTINIICSSCRPIIVY